MIFAQNFSANWICSSLLNSTGNANSISRHFTFRSSLEMSECSFSFLDNSVYPFLQKSRAFCPSREYFFWRKNKVFCFRRIRIFILTLYVIDFCSCGSFLHTFAVMWKIAMINAPLLLAPQGAITRYLEQCALREVLLDNYSIIV